MTTHATSGQNAARELRRLDYIIEELQRHVAQGGTIYDECVTDLYQDYYSLRRSDPVHGCQHNRLQLAVCGARARHLVFGC